MAHAMDNSVVIDRGRGAWQELEKSQGEINGDGKRLDLGW